MGMSHGDAKHNTARIATSTERESTAARSREALLDIREGMHVSRPRDMISVSLVCVSWAAFQIVRPWLYWAGLRRGMKTGCDVRLMWFFVPASIYGEKFEMWLKVWGVVMSVGGAVAFCYALVVLGRNMFAAGRWERGMGDVSDVESQRYLLYASGLSSRDGSSTASMSRSEYQHRRTPGRRRSTYFRCIAAVQLFVFAVTVVMVEGTILTNGIDMARGDLRTSSEVFALVVGLVTSVPVYWECLVIMPLRWAARKKEEASRTWSF